MDLFEAFEMNELMPKIKDVNLDEKCDGQLTKAIKCDETGDKDKSSEAKTDMGQLESVYDAQFSNIEGATQTVQLGRCTQKMATLDI